MGAAAGIACTLLVGMIALKVSVPPEKNVSAADATGSQPETTMTLESSDPQAMAKELAGLLITNAVKFTVAQSAGNIEIVVNTCSSTWPPELAHWLSAHGSAVSAGHRYRLKLTSTPRGSDSNQRP